MNSGDIIFPHLGIHLTNVPQGFSVFGFWIALYGVIIGIGILCGILAATQIAKKTGQNPDVYWDFALYAVIVSVIGARLYYVAFSWEYYKNDLLSVFNLRQGGLAIYGGVIGAFLTIVVYCKIKKLKAWELGDTGMVGLILGQAIGRWGNFFNREVFGEYTDGLLAMQLPVTDVRARDISASIAAHMQQGQNYISVHPTFLYESLWNLALFFLLVFYTKRKKFHGEICLFYLGGYGLGRFWIEGIRTDTLFLPGTSLPVSQVLAGILVVFSIGMDIFVRIGIKKGKFEEFHPTLSPDGPKEGTPDMVEPQK